MDETLKRNQKENKTDCCRNCDYCRIIKTDAKSKHYEYICNHPKFITNVLSGGTRRGGWCKYHSRLRHKRRHHEIPCNDGTVISVWYEEKGADVIGRDPF